MLRQAAAKVLFTPRTRAAIASTVSRAIRSRSIDSGSSSSFIVDPSAGRIR